MCAGWQRASKRVAESTLHPSDVRHTATRSPSPFPLAPRPLLMLARYSVPVPPPTLGRSNVSHRLALSQQEKARLYLTLSTFSAACFAGLLLFMSVIPFPEVFPALRGDYRSRGTTSRSDNLQPLTGTHRPSSSWAAYSPYHPAGRYERTVREGCVVSQVNIVSSYDFHLAVIDLIVDPSL